MLRLILVITFWPIIVLTPATFLFSDQPSVTAISGVDEPLELTGPGKAVRKPSPEIAEEFATFLKSMDRWTDSSSERLALNLFIESHPAFSDAFFLRAQLDFCDLASNDYTSISADVDKAIKTKGPDSYLSFDTSDLPSPERQNPL